MTENLLTDSPEPLMSVTELAAFVGVPVATVYAWRSSGRGPRGIRIGRHVRFALSDVNSWIERQRDPVRPRDVF